MREQVLKLVGTYLEAVRTNHPGALGLHPDIVFESPLNSLRGIAAFEKSLLDFHPILKGIEIVHLTADDTTCAAALRLDTIYGILPFLEFFQIQEGKIANIRAYYDPRPVLEGMSRNPSKTH
jgi:hypothetical protein